MTIGDFGSSKFGQIGGEITTTSTLELDAEVAGKITRGKMVFVVPDPPFNHAADCNSTGAELIRVAERFGRAVSVLAHMSGQSHRHVPGLGVNLLTYVIDVLKHGRWFRHV